MKSSHRRLLLCAILLYGLIVSLVDLDYNSVFIDEAFQITMGQEIIAGEPCLGCPHHTGSVMIWPVLAALADSVGGIHAVRILNVLIGLALTVIVYATAATLFGGSLGLIAAALFMFTGQTLYLMKLGTYDMIAAFFIGASFFMFVVSASVGAPWHRNLAIVFGAAALFLAAITKYLLPVFVPSLVLYVLFTHGIKRTALFCVLPLAVLGALYLGFDQYAPGCRCSGRWRPTRTSRCRSRPCSSGRSDGSRSFFCWPSSACSTNGMEERRSSSSRFPRRSSFSIS